MLILYYICIDIYYIISYYIICIIYIHVCGIYIERIKFFNKTRCNLNGKIKNVLHSDCYS